MGGLDSIPVRVEGGVDVGYATDNLRPVLLQVEQEPRSGAPGRNRLRIVVEDDGPGIAEDKVQQMLQRGVRGDERVQGHGIGLSIVQDIIASYQGELKVGRSEELGGARFEVVLG